MADRPDVLASSGSTVQVEIETAMRGLGKGERWESIFLFSSEGLLMARHGFSSAYDEEKLLEFAFSLIGVVRLEELSPLLEGHFRVLIPFSLPLHSLGPCRFDPLDQLFEFRCVRHLVDS